ncbi:Cadherin-like protein 26 [Bagarius yarrelli]|uniref:Cadherin-like protein 26 n=1 Tax=Bagarius yarrelli TaxID=175774 RepID=A0A556VU02_BAGYA|nr:Cadherin-like protein 26 [Bagarius yarrelli]
MGRDPRLHAQIYKSVQIYALVKITSINLCSETSNGKWTNQGEKTVATNERVLIRSKRRWVVTTIELIEGYSGPFPVKITKLFNDRQNIHNLRFSISGHGVDQDPVGVLSIDEDTGEVYMHKPIDREEYPVFHVEFNVFDKTTGQLLDNTLSFDVTIKDRNDNSPLFQSQILSANVPENMPEGELPISLHVSDRDGEGTDNSRVSMRIVSQEPESPTISLKPVNDRFSNLSLSGCFDYDKTRTYRLLVEAKDHGTPPLSSTATVNIDVTDTNTHPPVITAPKHRIRVHEMEANKEILRIPVEDQDTPNTPASRAVFTILKGNEEGNYKIETDPLTNEGVLTVIKAKDFERVTVTQLEIGVENEDPLFVCADGKPVYPIPETLKNNSKIKVTVEVIDVNDPPMYELVDDPAKLMSIDPKTGKLTLAKKIDRESPYVNDNTYTVVMRAIDDGNPPATGTGTLVVHLIDTNDNAPRLTSNMTTLCVNKGERVDIIPTDADDFPFSGPFTFKLGTEDQELKRLWKLQPSSGDQSSLISLTSLPYGTYLVPLTIADQQGLPTHENVKVVVCKCTEKDVCEDLGRSSNLHGAAIGILLGAILLMALLLCMCFFCEFRRKKEFKQYLQFDGNQTLIAYNDEGAGSSCKSWTRNGRMSANETVWSGLSKSYSFTIEDLLEMDGVLIRSKRRWVLTTIELEEDLPGPYPRKFTQLHNDKYLDRPIVFKISGQGVTEEPKDLFSIDKNTGELYLNRPIDREAFHTLRVMFDVLDKETLAVVDKTLAFNVAIKDKNDNPPKFIPEVLNVNVSENTKEGQLPFTLQVRDSDEEGNDNSRISIRMVSQEPALPKFSLDIPDLKDSKIAKLTFTGCFDYDKVKYYKLLVEARDHGTPPLSSTVTVNIHITDFNTHAPVFTAPEFNAQVMEMQTNKDILRIPVQDKDTPNTPGSRAVFTILKGNENGNYRIETDPLTNEGVLSVIKPKDYEASTLTELEIAVENEEPLFLCVDGKPVSPTLKRNTAKVAVKVIDVNDPPVFSKNIQTVFRVEEEEPGDVLYIPTVTDEDSDANKIRYKTAKPPATGTGTLVIKLGDKNDNAPYLTCNSSVICGNKADSVKVTANDADDFPYGGPFTYSLAENADPELKSMWAFEQRVSETFLISLKSLPYGNYSVPLTIADQQGVQNTRCPASCVLCDCGNGTVCKDLLPRFTTLNGAAIGILLGALILMFLLLCFCFSCECQKKNFKECLQHEGNQTLITYNEEGGGTKCQDSFLLFQNYTQGPTANHPGLNATLTQVPNRFSSLTDKRNIYAASSELYKLTMDQVHIPEHQPRHYTSEGNISNATSLDKISVHNTGDQDELDFLQNLGPKFSTLAEIIQQGMKEKKIQM